MPDRVSNLGVSYRDRFQRLGELEDLEKSIEHETRALALTPDGHPYMPDRVSNLGVSYRDRFQRLGELEDLERSIEHKNRALALTPDGHPDMPDRVTSLAISYSDRYRRLGELEDLEKSIEHNLRALALTPRGHPYMSDRVSSLAIFYRDRFQRLGELEDLEKSIEHNLRALALTPDGHPNMPDRVSNLGISYRNRYRRLGELKDLEKSIDYNLRALALTPDGHPRFSQRYFGLAISRLDQFNYTHNPSHLQLSLDCFRKASQLSNGAPRDSFQNALVWAKHATKHTLLNPMEAYQVAIDLLPHFIWLGATTTQKYQDLSITENLAANAAVVAILSSRHTLALEWLEHARCVVWSQSLMLRSPLDQLHTSHPDLAAKLKKVTSQLDGASFEAQAAKAPSYSIAPEKVGPERRRLAAEYHSLLAETRLQPGFEGFLQPMKAKKFVRAAQHGPIVVINCHEDRCDALLLLPGQENVSHLSLPNFTTKMAQRARFEITVALRQTGLRERGVRPRQVPGPKDRFERVLAMLWDDIVKPVLDFLEYTKDVLRDHLPHITWCPTGALSFLPLHAAGNYSQPRSKVFDYAISSYTPTLTALLNHTQISLNSDCRVLGIGQANTPRRSPLPGTVEELTCLRAHVQGKAIYSQLVDDQATTTAVLDAMEQHDWVHLACHAHQNVEDPTKSGFFLHDGTLDLASINRRSFKNKGLAFLSACQTARGDEKLPDEAVHLASGMLMAGYPSVIATMWSVSDQDAPLVADKVYAQLVKEGKVGNGEAGRALHNAVAALREGVGEKEFGRWVPYIHIGS
ncbi:unnamed protein product [Rhizoctonia solani]|uniref:CHAT domain-containing protein n=1 Tax=Rhizoctonia solani TaxID=456999 RepID=A0A8H3C9P9_9AGAM|nr:unnamed protein product [Rhizoctonia solani]